VPKARTQVVMQCGSFDMSDRSRKRSGAEPKRHCPAESWSCGTEVAGTQGFGPARDAPASRGVTPAPTEQPRAREASEVAGCSGRSPQLADIRMRPLQTRGYEREMQPQPVVRKISQRATSSELPRAGNARDVPQRPHGRCSTVRRQPRSTTPSQWMSRSRPNTTRPLYSPCNSASS
jgi:hypothetical protein